MKRTTRASAKAASPDMDASYTNGVGDSNGKSATNGAPKASVDTPTPGTEQSALFRFFSMTVMPLVLMFWSPNMIIVLWYTAVKCNGSFLVMYQRLTENGILNGLLHMWTDIHIGSTLALYIILGYCVFALILMVVLPGPRADGPVTPKGNVPVYKDNGFFCYVVTMVALVALTFFLKSRGLTPTVVYDHFDEFIGSLTVFSHILCVFLTIKGLVAPSSTDSGSTGYLVMDYYWGTELYPRVFGIDIKVFTNCRFGMTVWPILVFLFAVKSYELHGFVDSMWVSCILHMMYFTKFFWWESGYMRTIDIMLDRAGFYICWGCLCFVPGLYASTSLYLVNHPVQLGWFWSAVILAAGAGSIALNFIADKQKQDVRASNGNCLIWGKKPEVIRAKYRLESGEMKESILLVSGWWGVARHFHYVPELLLSFFWCLPGLFENVAAYTYFLWLCVLLTHRTFRDDTKCRQKYTTYWDEYCQRVPYKMIPGIF